ncbi:MAG: hypothetical protein K9N06_11825 [Candidatus Cloacimonetes bacterium]|nr:hypothetical protein [Candidatus Cloacimonadota bacterium]
MGKTGKENPEEEIFFQHYFQKALVIGKYFCYQIDLAEEVAQLSVIKLYLWKDKIVNTDKWIYQVARNYSLQIIKKQKKSAELELHLKHKKEQEEYSDLAEHPDLNQIFNELPTEFLDKKDIELAMDFYCNGFDKQKLVEKYDLDLSKVSEKLYHIRQEIILFLKFTGEFMFIPQIAGTRLNRNIHNFIRKLKHCLETLDFSELIAYTDNIDEIENLKNARKLIKLLHYKLRYIENGKYRLIIFYLTDKKMPYIIIFDVELADWKKIRMISRPVLPTRIIRINQAMEVSDEIYLKVKQEGDYLLNKEEAEKLINSMDTMDTTDLLLQK